jgi:flagellar basal-body rod protein FlgC
MSAGRIASPTDIAISGMRAQAMRMNTITTNIANAHTTRTSEGGPYRRKEVVLSTGGDGLTGVQVTDVQPDLTTGFKRVHEPGHPDADKAGYVNMPNVNLPQEMMHMMAASRAYEANAAVLKRHKEIMQVTLEMLR